MTQHHQLDLVGVNAKQFFFKLSVLRTIFILVHRPDKQFGTPPEVGHARTATGVIGEYNMPRSTQQDSTPHGDTFLG